MIMKYKKKKIFKLDEVEEERVSVFALVSQAKDYKLSWHLNKLLSIDLQKDKNYICRGKSFFSRFKFLDSEKYGSLTLTSNNSGKGYLETTQKKINYFLTTGNILERNEKNELVRKINTVSEVLFAFEIDFKKTRDLDNIILND